MAKKKSKEARSRDFASRRRRAKDIVYQDKVSKGCSNCPEKRPSALDYHHVDPSTKTKTVNRLLSQGRIGSLKREMEKCILLCANCHRVVERGDGFRQGDGVQPPAQPFKETHQPDEVPICRAKDHNGICHTARYRG
jgi:hypothetical protein